MIYKCEHCGQEYNTFTGAQECEKKCNAKGEEANILAKQEQLAKENRIGEIKHLLSVKEKEINQAKEDFNRLYEDALAKTRALAEHKNDVRALIDEFESLCPNFSVEVIDDIKGYRIKIKEQPKSKQVKSNFKESSFFDLINGIFDL